MLIADDEPLFIETVQAILAGDDRVEVVGTAGNGKDAVELATSLKPDVTLMDISMPILDGIEATRHIRERVPDACVLVLTGSSISADVDRARQAGVAAFLTKDRLGTQLVNAILEIGGSLALFATLRPVFVLLSFTESIGLPAIVFFHFVTSIALVTLVLMHSGRDTGMAGMGYVPASQGGTHIVERNLTRLTIVVGTIFFANTIVLYHLLA